MNKRQKGILAWILIWAGMLILVLYSPVGSPDLYSTSNLLVANQSVTFQNGEIQNAPNVNYSSANTANELNVPDYNTQSRTNYSVGNYPSASNNSPSMSTNYSVQTQNYQNNRISTGDNGVGGGTFISGNRSGNSQGSGTITMNNGIASLSTDLNPNNNNSITRQGASQAGGQAWTDPGGDPTGPPIPVGDGWVFLLLLAVGYGLLKAKYYSV